MIKNRQTKLSCSYIRVHVCFSYHRRANHPVSVIASTIPRFSARARPTACTYFLRPRSVPCGSLAYVSLSQSLLDVVAQARAAEERGREGRRGEGRGSVLYEISPAFNLGRGYVVISVQDTATLWKPEPLTWRERAITRLAGHAPWCVCVLEKFRCHFR